MKTLPIHRRIYNNLLNQMQQGVLTPGCSLPTERELQELYGVSRVPVRQALGRLEAEGLIQRTPGRGTEVLSPKSGAWVGLSGFAHFYNRAEKMTSITLGVEPVLADDEIAEHLGMNGGDLVVRVRRVRLIQMMPTAYMNNYFAPTTEPVSFPSSDSGVDYSLREFIRAVMNRDEVEIQEDIRAVGAPDDAAQSLGLPAGHPVLFVTRRGWDARRHPVEFTRYWARTDVSSYRTFLST